MLYQCSFGGVRGKYHIGVGLGENETNNWGPVLLWGSIYPNLHNQLSWDSNLRSLTQVYPKASGPAGPPSLIGTAFFPGFNVNLKKQLLLLSTEGGSWGSCCPAQHLVPAGSWLFEDLGAGKECCSAWIFICRRKGVAWKNK